MSLFEACQRVDVEEIKFLIKENVRNFIFVFSRDFFIELFSMLLIS